MTSAEEKPLCAAIDLGTNTFLLLVGRLDAHGDVSVVEDLCRTPRLGAGLARTGALDEASIERGLRVLEEFRERLATLDVDSSRVRAVGTAALRRASNASAFVERAAARCNLRVEIIGETEEARLGHAAVVDGGASADSVIVDVGGGSTEVVVAGGTIRLSIPIGAVVLTERRQGGFDGRAWTDKSWRALEVDVASACRALPAEAMAQRDQSVVTLGGTGANFACLELGFERFEPRATEGSELDAKKVQAWAELLRRLDREQRLALPIETERADILPAGLACLAGVLSALGAQRIRVTGRGLRYGVLSELVRARSDC